MKSGQRASDIGRPVIEIGAESWQMVGRSRGGLRNRRRWTRCSPLRRQNPPNGEWLGLRVFMACSRALALRRKGQKAPTLSRRHRSNSCSATMSCAFPSSVISPPNSTAEGERHFGLRQRRRLCTRIGGNHRAAKVCPRGHMINLGQSCPSLHVRNGLICSLSIHQLHSSAE